VKRAVFAVLVLCIGGCTVRQRTPQDGTVRSTRYSFVHRMVLEHDDTYREGRLIVSRARFADGTPAMEMVSEWGDPMVIRSRYHHPNGTMMRQSRYENDTLMTEDEWYPDGMQRLMFRRRPDRSETVVRWHRNGIRSDESEWFANERNGRWTQYDTTGRRTRNERYRDGIKVR